MPRRGVEGAGKGFVQGLGPMMAVLSRQDPPVQGKPCFHRERHQHVPDEIRVQRSQHGLGDWRVDLAVSPSAYVDHRQRERFVERRVGVGDSNDSPPITQRLIERATEKNGDVLGGVVGVDVPVSLRLNSYVK